ncbi:MAG: AEC family transporter [Enterobacterales bacterium]|nr:AEC family transporter [Enterobacterales bacterium]
MVFIVIFTFLVLGFALKQFNLLTQTGAKWTSHYVISICMPAIILLKFPNLIFNWDLLFPSIMAWILIPIAWLLVLWLSRIFQWSLQVEACVLLMVCFGNTSFVGYPLVQAFLGDNALVYAVVYDQMGSFLTLAIVASLIVSVYKNKIQNNRSHTEANQPFFSNGLALVKTIFTFPPFVAIFISIPLRFYPLPSIVTQVFELIGRTLVPSTMLLIGYYMVFKLPRRDLNPLYFSLIIKMLLLPFFAWLLLFLLSPLEAGQFALFAQTTFMEAAMPPMVTTCILAIHNGFAPRLASAAVGYGLLLAIITIPLVYLISQRAV